MKRLLRVAGTLVVTGLAIAYLLYKIDLGRTGHELAHARIGYFLASLGIMIVTVWPMAWRWQQLLRAKGVEDRLPWLVRTYFVSYMVGQVLPTSIGGDASRIYETTRRHPGNGGPIAGSVLLERALGGAATLLLAAIGFVLATIVLAVAVFSVRVRPLLARTVPLLRRLWLERPLRAVYEGIHSYRENAALLIGVFTLTLGVQAVRVLAIWLTGKAVGVGLSPRPYYVMGPLLFLVMLVPFTINGLAVRESFFVSFLGNLGVGADPAFATGFLFFVVTIGLALPGAGVLAWESLRGARAAAVEHEHG